jgi:hypothetical protein
MGRYNTQDPLRVHDRWGAHERNMYGKVISTGQFSTVERKQRCGVQGIGQKATMRSKRLTIHGGLLIAGTALPSTVG